MLTRDIFSFIQMMCVAGGIVGIHGIGLGLFNPYGILQKEKQPLAIHLGIIFVGTSMCLAGSALYCTQQIDYEEEEEKKKLIGSSTQL